MLDKLWTVLVRGHPAVRLDRPEATLPCQGSTHLQVRCQHWLWGRQQATTEAPTWLRHRVDPRGGHGLGGLDDAKPEIAPKQAIDVLRAPHAVGRRLLGC